MPLSFVKISATGNDFILIDNRDGQLQAARDGDFFRAICRRRLSVGADGVILLENSERADFRYVHINSDGSIAEMCGNGSRAIVYFAAQLGIIKDRATFEINHEIYHAKLVGNRVTTEFIPPSPADLSLDIFPEMGYRVGGFITVGVPHLVIFTADVARAEVERLGRKYRHHPLFPAGTNVDFVQMVEQAPIDEVKSHLLVRTYERGVEAETLACGTGAVASAIISHLRHGTNSPLRVTFPGGDLLVTFDANLSHITLSGEVTMVYRAELLSAPPEMSKA